LLLQIFVQRPEITTSVQGNARYLSHFRWLQGEDEWLTIFTHVLFPDHLAGWPIGSLVAVASLIPALFGSHVAAGSDIGRAWAGPGFSRRMARATPSQTPWVMRHKVADIRMVLRML
jgi:hypothetical protein